ncbi:MAG TPA: response regulator [Thermoanaerobaculia bacterium]|nr:response regulator [Thermoanaerobaculia bacterium]
MDGPDPGAPGPGSASQKARARILLVEDDADLRESLCKVLEEAGYEVDGVRNGQEALEYLHREQPPCVVLLDLMMPVMTGWEFRDAQRGDPALSDIPVVILTADGRAQSKADSLGVGKFLRKPVQLEELLGTVRSFQCGAS